MTLESMAATVTTNDRRILDSMTVATAMERDDGCCCSYKQRALVGHLVFWNQFSIQD